MPGTATGEPSEVRVAAYINEHYEVRSPNHLTAIMVDFDKIWTRMLRKGESIEDTGDEVAKRAWLERKKVDRAEQR